MEGLELISFQIITTVGSARSCYIEAIQEAKKGNFDRAEEMVKEGTELFNQGHDYHNELLQMEAKGDHVAFNLLLMHAEDQSMMAECFRTIAEEFIAVHKELKELKAK